MHKNLYHTHVFDLAKNALLIGSGDTFLSGKKILGVSARKVGKSLGGLLINTAAVSGSFIEMVSGGVKYAVLPVELLAASAANGKFIELDGRVLNLAQSGIVNYSGETVGVIEITFIIEE
jgi:hypothetical protein